MHWLVVPLSAKNPVGTYEREVGITYDPKSSKSIWVKCPNFINAERGSLPLFVIYWVDSSETRNGSVVIPMVPPTCPQRSEAPREENET